MTFSEALQVIRETNDVMHNDGTWTRNRNVDRYREVWKAMLAAGIDPKEALP